MRASRRLGPLAALALVGGCKTERKDPPAPPPVPSAGTPGSAAGSAVATHVTLPRSPATPPRPTTGPLDRAELDRLAAFAFPDFERDLLPSPAPQIRVQHLTATRPKLAVTVTIGPCETGPEANQPCVAMALPAWQARLDELRAESLNQALRDRPDTRFELGARDLHGAPAIYTYQVGWYFGPDAHGQPGGTYSDAYVLYYNDGNNQIRVHADYADDALGTVHDMVALAPKDDLEQLAVAFLSFYVHEWK